MVPLRPISILRSIVHLLAGAITLPLLASILQPQLDPTSLFFNSSSFAFWITSATWLSGFIYLRVHPYATLHSFWLQYILPALCAGLLLYTPIINWTVRTFNPSSAAPPLLQADLLDLSVLTHPESLMTPQAATQYLQQWALSRKMTLMGEPYLQKLDTPLRSQPQGTSPLLYYYWAYIQVAKNPNGTYKTLAMDARELNPSPATPPLIEEIDSPTTVQPSNQNFINSSRWGWWHNPLFKTVHEYPSVAGGLCLKLKNTDNAPCSPRQLYWTQISWANRPFQHLWTQTAYPSHVHTLNPLSLFAHEHPETPPWILNKIPAQSAQADLYSSLQAAGHYSTSIIHLRSLFVHNLRDALRQTQQNQQELKLTAATLIYGSNPEFLHINPSLNPELPPQEAPPQSSPNPEPETLLHIFAIKSNLLNYTFALDSATGIWYRILDLTEPSR